MTPQEKTLFCWFKRTLSERTTAVKENRAPIDWIDPGTRVSWSEVVSKASDLGIVRSPADLRVWWWEQTGK